MRSATEEENELYDDMLERISMPLEPAPSKVWIVHEESGECSGWRYDVKGVFSTREMAREYVERQLTMECRHYVGTAFPLGVRIEVDDWSTERRMYLGEREGKPKVVEEGTTRCVTKDGVTFWAEYPDGERVRKPFGEGFAWHVTAYDVDCPKE